MSIVVFAVGSPIVADVAETCLRLRLPVAAWVRNFSGESFAPIGAVVLEAAELEPDLLHRLFIVPLFTPRNRHAAVAEASRRGFKRPATLIDPTAVVASSTTVERGSYVNTLANIGAAGRIGAFAFINRGASIGHHADIAKFVSIGPGAVVAGQVQIGPGAMIGAGAVVLPRISVGANAIVAAGAVVTRPVEPNTLVAGNPARLVRDALAS
jgi:sugar O-acyltransferase (sialic acid O-acetyltransferase NeuD family)